MTGFNPFSFIHRNSNPNIQSGSSSQMELSAFTIQGLPNQTTANPGPLEASRFSTVQLKFEELMPLNTLFISEQIESFINSFPQDLQDGWQEFQTRDGSYTGPVKNGKPLGMGVIIVPSGEYEGEFNVLPQGKGVLKTFMSTINGTFTNGKCEGLVKASFVGLDVLNRHKKEGYIHVADFVGLNQPEKYEGEYTEGRCEGKGRYIWPNGAVYEGEFKNGKMEGKGLFLYPNGDAYQGNWLGNCRHGHGTFTTLHGVIYEGNFNNDKMEGNGKCLYPDKTQYEGQWVDGKFHGNGRFTHANGDVYEGNFVHDLMEGNGIYRFANGAIFEGVWINGNKHGRGKYTEINGAVYEGSWANDQRTPTV